MSAAIWVRIFDFFSWRNQTQLGGHHSFLRASWWQGKFHCWGSWNPLLCSRPRMHGMVESVSVHYSEELNCTDVQSRLNLVLSETHLELLSKASFHDLRASNQLIEISVPCLGCWNCELCVLHHVLYSLSPHSWAVLMGVDGSCIFRVKPETGSWHHHWSNGCQWISKSQIHPQGTWCKGDHLQVCSK